MVESASDAFLALAAEVRNYLMRNSIINISQGMIYTMVCLLSNISTIPAIADKSRFDRRSIKTSIDELIREDIVTVVNPNDVVMKQKFELRDVINVHDWVPMALTKLIEKVEEAERVWEDKSGRDKMQKRLDDLLKDGTLMT